MQLCIHQNLWAYVKTYKFISPLPTTTTQADEEYSACFVQGMIHYIVIPTILQGSTVFLLDNPSCKNPSSEAALIASLQQSC